MELVHQRLGINLLQLSWSAHFCMVHYVSQVEAQMSLVYQIM